MSSDTLERDLRAAFTARADATQFRAQPQGIAPVPDLADTRSRRPVAVALAAAAAVVVAVAAVSVVARDTDDNGLSVTETSMPDATQPSETTVPITTAPQVTGGLMRPMTFANGEPVVYALPGVPASPTNAAFQCTAGRVEGESYLCTEVSGTFASSTRDEFVATNHGTNAANTQGLEPADATRIDVRGHPAVLAHYATRDAASAGGVPVLIGGGDDGPVATATWLLAPHVRVNVQATDRDDAAMVALLESLVATPLAVESLPLAVVGNDYDAIVLMADDNGELCYSQSAFGECEPIGDTDEALGFPANLYTRRPYGWARADVDHITVTAPDGSASGVTFSEVVDDAGHRIWRADSDLMPVTMESQPLTITAYDAAGNQIGKAVMDGGQQ